MNSLYDGNNSSFARAVGVGEAGVRSYLPGTLPKADVLEKISNNTAISCEWLITGRGNLLKNTPSEIPDYTQTVGIPLIPIEAMAGMFSNYTQIFEYDCEKSVIPTFKGTDFHISVKGSSMYPKYSSGDIVACKKLSLDTFFSGIRYMC